MTIYAGMGRMTKPKRITNKIKIEVDNDCLDALVVGALKRTRKMLRRSNYAPGTDDGHIVHACETLIRWYGLMNEAFDEEK